MNFKIQTSDHRPQTLDMKEEKTRVCREKRRVGLILRIKRLLSKV